MRVLVAVASKHGSTAEIGDAISRVLVDAGYEVYQAVPDPDVALERFDAVVCGSAVYGGSWRPDAVRFLEVRADDLRAKPVWLFETGPVSSVDLIEPGGAGIALGSLVAARGLQVFGGKLDRSRLTVGEKVITRIVGATDSDDRDWDVIKAWAGKIAETLDKEAQVSS
jgi:menaquinone-dependent protoporphyrinogen oxidase